MPFSLPSPMIQLPYGAPFPSQLPRYTLRSPSEQAFLTPLECQALLSPLWSPLRPSFPMHHQVMDPTVNAAMIAMQQQQYQRQQSPALLAESPAPTAHRGAKLFHQIFSMSFATQVEAFEACQKLAIKCGFGVRRRTSKAKTVYIVCSREGRPEQKKDGPRQRKRTSTRCNCDWRIVLFLTSKKTWEFRVGKCMTHNHGLKYEEFCHTVPGPQHPEAPSPPAFPGCSQVCRTLMTPSMSPTEISGMQLANLPEMQGTLSQFSTNQLALQLAASSQQEAGTVRLLFPQNPSQHVSAYDTQAEQAAVNLLGLAVRPNLVVGVAAPEQLQSPSFTREA